MSVLTKHKLSGIFLVVFLTVIAFQASVSVGVRAQGSPYAVEENPFHVYFNSLPSFTPGKVNGLIVIQIDYDDIRFLKDEDRFVAHYEMSIEIMNRENEIVERKYWTEEIVAEDFKATILKDVGFTKKIGFDLDPGVYNYVVQMSDKDALINFERKGSKVLRDYWGEHAGIGDLIFTRTTEIDTSFDGFIPSNEFIRADFNEGFSAQFQLFSFDKQRFVFVWRVYNVLEETIALHGDSLSIEPGERIISIDIPFNGISFHPGVYLIRVTMYHPSGGKKERTKQFSFTWINRPVDMYDFERAIEQMEYIINDDDWSDIKEADEEEKREFFINFWNERDIFPETEENDLLEEYFMRVEVANQEFKVEDKPGWKTDRGRIFCVYGRPDSREVYAGQTGYYDTPARETWTYLEARKRFVFVDRSRKGYFLLVSETTISR